MSNHLIAIQNMASISLQASIICTILLLSAIAVTLSETTTEDDNDHSSDGAAAARRLLQKIFYRMPKLNFCELMHCSN